MSDYDWVNTGCYSFTLNTTIPEMIDSMNSISIVRITFIRCMLVGSVKHAKGFHHFGVVRPMTYSGCPAPIVMQLNIPLCNIIV